MIVLRRGRIVDYKSPERLVLGNISDYIGRISTDMLAQELTKTSDRGKYRLVIESSRGLELDRGGTTNLSVRIYTALSGLDVTEQLQSSDLEIRWRRVIPSGADRAGVSDTTWSTNRRGWSITVGYNDLRYSAELIAEVYERSVTDILIPTSPVPGSIMLPREDIAPLIQPRTCEGRITLSDTDRVDKAMISSLASKGDLVNYVTTTSLAHQVAQLQPKGSYATTQQLTEGLASKLNTSALTTLATKEEVATKANSSELSRYVTTTALDARSYATTSQLSLKADTSDLTNTNTRIDHTSSLALRPTSSQMYNSSAGNTLWAPIKTAGGNTQPNSVSINLMAGSDLYLPNARDCVLGSKIYISGSALSCPTQPRYGATQISPIRIYSSSMDIYTPGGYLMTGSNLIETFTYAEFRVDLECIIAGCGLKAWLWVNYNETRDLGEYDRSISNISQSLNARITSVNNQLAQRISTTESNISNINTQLLPINRLKIPTRNLRHGSGATLEGNGGIVYSDKYASRRVFLPSASAGMVGEFWYNAYDTNATILTLELANQNNIIRYTNTGFEGKQITLTRDHHYRYVAINSEIWLVTDLSR